MRKTTKILLLALFVFALTCTLSVGAYAVPAAPGCEKGSDGVCRSHAGDLVTLSDLTASTVRREGGPLRSEGKSGQVADLPLAVIVVGFADQPYRKDLDWTQEMFRSEKSLASYYLDMSCGQFTFSPAAESSAFGVGGNACASDVPNDGVIHITLDSAHDDWTLEYSFMSKKDIATNRSLMEALSAAMYAAADYLDYSAYDADGSGAIETDELALAFVFAGYEAASAQTYTHGKTAYLWAHAWSLSEAREDYGFTYDLPTPDGVTVDSYIAIGEQENDGAPSPISVPAHELGHYLGLPDLYDTNNSISGAWGKYDVGPLSLMCSGSWGSDPETGETIPYSLDVWSRYRLGWIAPYTAQETDAFTLSADLWDDSTTGDYLKVNTANPDEYYLLENRAFEKWDAGLGGEFDAEEGGILLWHVDEAVLRKYGDDNQVNNVTHRPAVMPLYPETENGTISFITAGKKPDTGDPFFDASSWQARFSHLGDALDLPVYGVGEEADRPAARTLSGVRIGFVDDASARMRILVNPEGHTHTLRLLTVVSPSCTQAGSGLYECAGCGRTFSDAAGTLESDAPFELAPLGHASPDADGKCVRCGEQIAEPAARCPLCGERHTGWWGGIVSFFHRLIYFFRTLFGIR